MSNKLNLLEQSVGYRFKRPELLERAVTHRSWAHEHLPDGTDSEIRALQNESFEFVGDSVLGLAVADHLFASNPDASEGELTLMKHQLVSTKTLARLASALDLGKYLRVGRGEEKTGGRRKQALLADMFEAIIAAVFFDGGYVAARAFVERVFADDLRLATPRSALDFKTLLQETLQSAKLPAPTYSVVRTEGPPHARTFHVEARWTGGSAGASGNSIKQAEMLAASAALDLLGSKVAADERQKS